MNRPFVVKNLAAEETHMTIEQGMRTLGDLREYIEEYMDLPISMQHLVSDGKSLDTWPHETLIQGCLPQTTEFAPIVWLLWMRDNDYISIYRGGLFLESEADQKFERHRQHDTGRPCPPGREFHAIRIREYKTISRRAITAHSASLRALGTVQEAKGRPNIFHQPSGGGDFFDQLD